MICGPERACCGELLGLCYSRTYRRYGAPEGTCTGYRLCVHGITKRSTETFENSFNLEGRISGTVTAEGSRAVANVQVALVPNRRDQWHLYRHVFTDGEGRFAFTDTAPGDYKLFAWETPVRNGYVDPVLLKEFEEQGKLIHVDEGRAAIATVPLTSLR